MTNEQIFKKAIDKAVKNGWTDIFSLDRTMIETIFSHDFAKAFWGNGVCERCLACKSIVLDEPPKGCTTCFYDWENHLQQMVLEKEPLKYLKKFL